MNRIWARKKFKNRRVMLMNYWCNLEWSDWSKSYQTTAYTGPLAAASQAAVTLSAENITKHSHRGRSIAFYHNNLWAFDLPKSVSSSAPKSRQTSKGCPEWHSFTHPIILYWDGFVNSWYLFISCNISIAAKSWHYCCWWSVMISPSGWW